MVLTKAFMIVSVEKLLLDQLMPTPAPPSPFIPKPPLLHTVRPSVWARVLWRARHWLPSRETARQIRLEHGDNGMELSLKEETENCEAQSNPFKYSVIFGTRWHWVCVLLISPTREQPARESSRRESERKEASASA